MDGHRHPANVARHDERTFGARAADWAAARLGSWGFIGAQTAVIVVWITLNVAMLVRHWDPYPFVLLNLAFSVQAAYAAPILQLAQNRQAEHDRIKAEHDYAVNEESLEWNRAIGAHLGIVPPSVPPPPEGDL